MRVGERRIISREREAPKMEDILERERSNTKSIEEEWNPANRKGQQEGRGGASRYYFFFDISGRNIFTTQAQKTC